jgi:hypothetical protein
MQRASVQLYYFSVGPRGSTFGLTRPLQRPEALAVMLTASSADCWLRFFRQLNH